MWEDRQGSGLDGNVISQCFTPSPQRGKDELRWSNTKVILFGDTQRSLLCEAASMHNRARVLYQQRAWNTAAAHFELLLERQVLPVVASSPNIHDVPVINAVRKVLTKTNISTRAGFHTIPPPQHCFPIHLSPGPCLRLSQVKCYMKHSYKHSLSSPE